MGHLTVNSKRYEGWDIGIHPIQVSTVTWADPGFGFISTKVWLFTFKLLNLSHFTEIPHENEIIWSH